ncbi:alpha/beta hydrolase fold [Lentzea fradiae]|uniref:Alpha/beta hydrolase fold n=1 Tax=Lentzea fradiae TaxID=200378 RepID=A0A1G7QGA9_9PSEU|nr:alpha/beta fold hydrolase [Lentzea fradiae]SDF97544.1 alpha/beta hydrolase fold [Lentzea fradiae]
MFRHFKTSAALALVAAAATAGVAVAGPSKPDVRSVEVGGGKSVHVSCSGVQKRDRPVVVLMAGLGDGLDAMAGFQETLSRSDRVCSYDRLGEGRSDQPNGPQSMKSTGAVLTKVIKKTAGGRPVVLVGHSLGGLIAARYAPEHRDTVKGVVLLDATSPTMVADLKRSIPAHATGPAADVRAQSLAVFAGQSPERLVVEDGPVRSAGSIPVEVVEHGQRYLEALPQYGPALEKAWAAGQRSWLKLSWNSSIRTAKDAGHYVHVDAPRVAVDAVQRVVAKASHR